jgi:hypothetical protein
MAEFIVLAFLGGVFLAFSGLLYLLGVMAICEANKRLRRLRDGK